MRILQVTSVVHCPFSDVTYFAEPFFRECLLGSPLGARARSVRIAPWRIRQAAGPTGAHDGLELRWLPSRPYLPTWYGLLSARPHYEGTSLCLQLSYKRPRGLLGALADRIFWRRNARRCIVRLAHTLADEVSEQWTRYRLNLESPRLSNLSCN